MFRVIREDKLKSNNISKFYLVQHQSLNVELHSEIEGVNITIRDSRSILVINPVLDALSFNKDILSIQQVY